MKVMHVDSGLGNQMLAYCEYLAMKKMHPEEACYIENIIYDIPDVEKVTSMWNGYELKEIFGINPPNVRELFDEQTWQKIVIAFTESRFWEKDWNWPVYGTEIFKENGLNLMNLRGDFEAKKYRVQASPRYAIRQSRQYKFLQKTSAFEQARQLYKHLFRAYSKPDIDALFYKGTEDAYGGMRLDFMKRGSGIERIDQDIRRTFVFPVHADERNIAIEREIESCDSVGVHIRRGDMMPLGARYFKSGYFKRAVKHMCKHISEPRFYIFSDSGSAAWCRENSLELGIGHQGNVSYVDWNKGKESYRDMQLMSKCRHNIITNSSFGWWGAYLNSNPNKITISSEIEINTTVNL